MIHVVINKPGWGRAHRTIYTFPNDVLPIIDSFLPTPRQMLHARARGCLAAKQYDNPVHYLVPLADVVEGVPFTHRLLCRNVEVERADDYKPRQIKHRCRKCQRMMYGRP